ncbi:MAG TPA: hypothetical protein VJ032_05040 [Thermoanaerobaculia bacterium]|nr:hypothetical protein [Thermoanaerobaculia bacterium]
MAAVSGISPNDDVSAFDPPSSSLMIVSHLPFLSRLASHLLVGDASREIAAFENRAIARIVQTGNGWRLAWLIAPDLPQSP